MTTLNDCLDGLILTGKMDKAQAKEVSDLTNRLQEQYAKTMSQSAAERAAAERAVNVLSEQKALAKRQKALQALRTHKNAADILSHPKGATAGALSKLVKDQWGLAKWSNVENRMKTWQGLLHGKLSDLLNAFRSKNVGFKQDKAGIREFIRELFGEDTGNATAKDGAKAWRDTAEMARLAANDAGADIKKRADWHVPNHHDQKRILKAGQSRWVAKVKSLNIEVRNPDTGDIATGEQLDKALAAIWDTLATGGMKDMTPGNMGMRKLANRLGDPRLLQFKDANSWLSYNDAFGAGDIYGLLTGHIHSMARDIATIEVLGPNPDAMVRYMQDLVRQGRVARGKAGAGLDVGMVSAVYGHLNGRLTSPASEILARVAGGLRNLLSMAQLRRAAISATSDLKFLHQTAGWNGMDATKVLKRYFTLLNPKNAEDRIFAVRSGLIADSWTTKAISAKRFQDDIVGDGWTARLADSFHRATGLTPMTQAGRHAFGLEFLGFIADHTGKVFNELPDALRHSFQRYGITSEMWDVARKADLVEHKGAKFFRPENVAVLDSPMAKDAATRIHEMILEETDFAVPTPDARTRAILTGSTQRGTFWGEMARSITMYKSFSVTVMHTHLMRGAMATATGEKGSYLPSLLVGLTVMGAGSIALKDISKGKDLPDMTTPEFWGRAFAQGGGLGIFGDFLAAALSRYGGTLSETLAGPVFGGLVKDVVRLTFGKARKFYDGVDAGLAAEIVRFAKRYDPFETWYTSLAIERLIWNQLQIMSDPKHASYFARMQRRARKDYGQGFYWKPGKTSPSRAPDFRNTLGR